jgi:hypothetical protein
MAQTGFTPIQLFRTTTAAAAPTAGTLADGELAINLTDEKLYFKNAAGTVKLLAANITPVANGGTGVTTSTGTGSVVLSNSPTLVTPALGTPSSGTLTNATGLPIVAGTTGTLSIARGGTGTTSTTFANLTTNVTGTLPIANGGTGATTAAAARTGLGATTLGANIFTVANPSAVTFPRFNADNTVSSLSAADFRTAIGAGTGGGSVTSVGGTGTVNGISLSGTVTSSGNLTLGGTLSGVNLTTQVTGTLPVANGGTGRATLTANNVILGNGTTAVQQVAPGTVGNVLTSNGTTWTSAAAGGGGAEAFITQSTGGNQPPGSFNPSDSFALI